MADDEYIKLSTEEAIECIDAIHVQMFNSGNSKWTRACDMAKEALEKDIYKGPYQDKEVYYTGMGYCYYFFLCPTCKCVLDPEPKGLERKRKAEKGRCFSCGQALNWSDAKEV